MKYIFPFWTIVCGLLFCSCSDFLDAENKANIQADTYFITNEGKAALRVDVYSSLKTLVNNTDMTEWGTDLYMATKSGDPGDFQRFAYTPENEVVEDYYKSVYAMINKANGLMKYAPSDSLYVAEAKFLRCYGYYLLTQQFGGVPYVTEYIESIKKDFPRESLETVYKNIIAELETLRNNSSLPESGSTGGYITRQAVNTLLSKVCLAAGWDLGTEFLDSLKGTYRVTDKSYFIKAAKYAEDVIGGRKLIMSFEQKWAPANQYNDEEIFIVRYERSGYPGEETKGGHGRQNTYGSNLGDPTVTGGKPCSGTLVCTPKSLYLWDKGDARFDATFMTTYYNYFGTWGTTGYYAYYNASDDAKATMGIADRYFPWYYSITEVKNYISQHKAQLVKGTGPNTVHVHLLQNKVTEYSFDASGNINETYSNTYENYLKTQNAAVPCVKKFDDPNTLQLSNTSNDYRNIVVFHLSDVYLMAAEAYLLAEDETTSLQYLNEVRKRSGASTISKYSSYKPNYTYNTAKFGSIQPIDLILDERARELYAETCRWMDLRRTRQLVRYNLQFNTYLSENTVIKWLKPIPAAEISTNDSMTDADQNPGY